MGLPAVKKQCGNRTCNRLAGKVKSHQLVDFLV
jgi:hypothetical protein